MHKIDVLNVSHLILTGNKHNPFYLLNYEYETFTTPLNIERRSIYSCNVARQN